MLWEEVIDPEYGLQQDEWSLTGGEDGGPPTFGEHGQLKVVGWSGRYSKYDTKSRKNYRYPWYVVKCTVCSLDAELYGDGVFKTLKRSLVNLQVPCGCSSRPKWSKYQFSVLAKRKAAEKGLSFRGFTGEWTGSSTKVSLSCPEHGEWCTMKLSALINTKSGCPACYVEGAGQHCLKPDKVMIESFLISGAFDKDTKFWRSERRASNRVKMYWFVHCPRCNVIAEGTSGSLQNGCRPCACSTQQQQECYINWVADDHNNAIALKFGIATNSRRRVREQNSSSSYEIRNYQVYTFPDVASCKKAERECKKEFECGIIPKQDMPDGYTETTSVLNLSLIKKIYERNGGVLKEEQ